MSLILDFLKFFNIFRFWKLCNNTGLIKKYIIITTCLLFCSRFVAAEQNNYGPRFEIGIGSSVSRMQSEPDWSSNSYYSGSLNYAYRIIYGLSVQGGINLGMGDSPGDDWFEYGSHYLINSESGTYLESTWLGARYEIPMSLLKMDFHKINSVYLSGGMSWNELAFNSKTQKRYDNEYGWKSGDIYNLEYNRGSYRAVDLKGYYISAAARWRFDTRDTDENDSWFGSYGFDLGFRYNTYYDSEGKYDNIKPAKSDFSNFQIFIVGFLKVKLFY